MLGNLNATRVYEETRHFVPFAYLLTALLFARSGLYAARSQRPGLSRIVASLFQVAFVALIFAVISGEQFSSFYIFYGSLAFALLYVSCAAGGVRVGHGCAAASGRLPASGDADRHGHAHPRRRPRARRGRPPRAAGRRRVHLAAPTGRARSALLGALDDLADVLGSERIDEVIIADSDFPQVEAVELVDQCHRQGVRVRIAPSTMEILIHHAEFVPGQRVPLFELGPPVFEGIDFALKRTFDLIGASVCC